MEPKVPDNRLIQKYQNGDLQAFKKLFERYRDYVYKVFVIKGVPQQEAEDLTQDLFLTLIDNLKRFAFHSAFKTYLDQAIRYRLINFYRKRKQETVFFETHLNAAAEDDFENDQQALRNFASDRLPAEMFESSEFIEILRACILKITNLAGRAVLALWLDGYKLRLIARALSLPMGTVNSHLVRSRKAVKECLRGKYA